MGQHVATYCCQEEMCVADRRATWEVLAGDSSSSASRPQQGPGPRSQQGMFLSAEDVLMGERTAVHLPLEVSAESKGKGPSPPFQAYDPRNTCCKADQAENDQASYPVEALSYTPVRFDQVSSMDAERSHARYSKIAVHSTHTRTQRRTKAWEEWLKEAIVGRSVTLLAATKETQNEEGDGQPGATQAEGETQKQVISAELAKGAKCEKVPVVYSLDRSLTTLSFVPHESCKSLHTVVHIANIQVICPVSDFMVFFDQVDACLDEGDKARAVLLQYVADDTERKRVCFLEESEKAKDCFVQALTTLWLEKRNNHSMWF
mmetsp:Transcript_31921/g.74718  ORF Transcript_31921/g.74718 Transcript_31921/m.74718 type:complete len:318 (-) Transcript_31921:55-1008(-)